MKQKNMKKFSKIDTLSKLVKEGFNIDTLLKFDNNQLQALRERVLNEATTTQSQTMTFNLTNPEDEEKFKKEMIDLGPNSKPEQADIDPANKTATITKELGEDQELTRTNTPIQKYRKGDKEVEVLEKEDLDEVIMDMGAGDFDETSFENPDDGGFHTSQGPMDSYYSTDNKGTLIGAGTKQNKGQYSGNAKYLDTPSFHNPDAEGFDSDGPMDSYGGNGWDEEGFAGELNEFAPEPKYSFMNPVAKGHQSDGPRGHSSGLHEDSEEDSANSLEKMSGYDPYAGNTVGNEDGPSRNMKANDGMGMFERYVTKKDLMEVAKSKSQYNFHKLVLACKKSKYKDCGDGRNDNAVLKAAKEMSLKSIKDYTDTANPENLPEKVKEQKITEQWLLNLVEKYERPSMTKGQFLQTLNEIAVETQDVKVIDNDVEDAKDELPAWLDFDSLFMNSPAPTTKPAPTKPGVSPGIKPGRRNPFKPKPGPNPRPKAITESECKIGDISQLGVDLGLGQSTKVNINNINKFLKSVGSNCTEELNKKFNQFTSGKFTLQDSLEQNLNPTQHLSLPKNFQSIELTPIKGLGKVYTYGKDKNMMYWLKTKSTTGKWLTGKEFSKALNNMYKKAANKAPNTGGTFGWG